MADRVPPTMGLAANPAATGCGGHYDDQNPPASIRVLLGSGTISVVPFKDYVKDVLPNEWLAGWKPASLQAGAMAAKTYAWYWTNHSSGRSHNGQCFDVYDDTYSQVYKAGSHQPSTDAAVDATWSVSMRRGGVIFESQYRATLTGNANEGCGVGADGIKMSQWGSQACANGGKNYQQILQTYYSGVAISQGVGSAGTRLGVAGVSNGSAHLVLIGNDKNLYYNIHSAADTYQGWQRMDGVGTDRFTASSAAIGGLADGTNNTEVLAVGNDGNTYLDTRFNSDGHWSGWARLAGYDGAASFQASAVAIAGLSNGTAHMVAIGNDGNLYYNIHYDTGSSYQGWGPIDGIGTNRFNASSVAIGGMPDNTNNTQVTAIGNDGNTYLNTRFNSDGHWSGWANLHTAG